MKKLIVIILLFTFVKSNAQNFVQDTTAINRFKFDAGVFVPMVKLNDKIGASQIYSFNYSSKIDHNDILDLGFSIIVPQVKNEFNYTEIDSIYRVKNKGVNVLLGCKIHKQYFMNKNTSFEWISSLGVSFFSFEDKINPDDISGYYTDENGKIVYRCDTNTKALTSLFIGQGFGFKYKNAGIECMYNFTPYYWFQKKLDADFGNSSLILNLYYRIP